MPFRRTVLALVTVAFAVVAPLGAAATSSGVASTGSIAGTVTGLNGVPIVGACVLLHGGPPSPQNMVTDAGGGYEGLGRTSF